MKPITLHPLSVLAGLALAVVAAAQLPRHVPPPEPPVFGVVPAEWWVSIDLSTVNGTPIKTFTVPLDRRLVVTFVGPNGAILADGQPNDMEPVSYGYTNDRNGTRVVIPPGTLLTTNATSSSLWGYLEPVQ